MLITTSKVSTQTRQEGLEDSSRIVSVVDGRQLVDLCQEYEVGFKAEYKFDKSFLKTRDVEEISPPSEPSRSVPSDLTEILTKSIGESFERLGRTPIYKSASKTILARWSQRYPRKGQNYWYGLTSKDIASVDEYGVTHFAYVCDDVGAIVIPARDMLSHVNSGKLGRTPKEGKLRHYHIQFGERGAGLEWVMKNGAREEVSRFLQKKR